MDATRLALTPAKPTCCDAATQMSPMPPRQWVPTEQRRTLLETTHLELGHPHPRALFYYMKRKYFWQALWDDCHTATFACPWCHGGVAAHE